MTRYNRFSEHREAGLKLSLHFRVRSQHTHAAKVGQAPPREHTVSLPGTRRVSLQLLFSPMLTEVKKQILRLCPIIR